MIADFWLKSALWIFLFQLLLLNRFEIDLVITSILVEQSKLLLHSNHIHRTQEDIAMRIYLADLYVALTTAVDIRRMVDEDALDGQAHHPCIVQRHVVFFLAGETLPQLRK